VGAIEKGASEGGAGRLANADPDADAASVGVAGKKPSLLDPPPHALSSATAAVHAATVVVADLIVITGPPFRLSPDSSHGWILKAVWRNGRALAARKLGHEGLNESACICSA
jgi:hypothetical protein